MIINYTPDKESHSSITVCSVYILYMFVIFGNISIFGKLKKRGSVLKFVCPILNGVLLLGLSILYLD